MKINLLGGTYQARSVIASAQRCLNLFLQRTPLEQGEPSPAIHLPAPGLVPLSTPFQAMSMGFKPTSQVNAALVRWRPAALSISWAPKSTLVATLRRLRPLVINYNMTSVWSPALGKNLLENINPVSALSGTLARSRPLSEDISPSSFQVGAIGDILAAGHIAEGLLPMSHLVAIMHKKGALTWAIAPTSAQAATSHRARPLAEAVASTSALAATALNSHLNGGAIVPTSAVAGTLGRKRPASAALVPRSAQAVAVGRKRQLSAAVVPKSAQAGTLHSLGRMAATISPTSKLGATLTPNGAGTGYYTAVRNWYVATNGSDTSGTGTQTLPWATIQGANNSGKLQAGDVVNVAPGVYFTTGYGLTAGGNTNSLTGYVVYRSTTPFGAVIRVNTGAQSIIVVTGNYIMLDGFEVDGGNAGRTSPLTTENGIYFQGHHNNALNNKCHDCGGNGIGALFKDWYTLDGNICYNNAVYNTFQTSGISIYEPGATAYTPSAADLAATYHIIVQNNICYNNGEYGVPGSGHTDGNGIIMDDWLGSQGNNPYQKGVAYPYQGLIHNNTCYTNGGRGVHIFQSRNCTVTNNTAYNNMQDQNLTGTERGDICCVDSNNCTFTNNKSTSTSGTTNWLQYNTAVLHARCTSITWTGNATYDPRTGQRSYNIDDATVRANFPTNNPLGGLLP